MRRGKGTCPACGGSKVDEQGRQCWGCNGHGVVEFTSDEEADVVFRNGRPVDRGTNKPGDPVHPMGSGCTTMIVLVIISAGVLASVLGYR